MFYAMKSYDSLIFQLPVVASKIIHRFLLQLNFCDDACIHRYLKARGNNVRRAARMLRATLNWREKIEIGRCSHGSLDLLIVFLLVLV